jgi:hypothetical protein
MNDVVEKVTKELGQPKLDETLVNAASHILALVQANRLLH